MKRALGISICFLLAFAFLTAEGIGRAETKTEVWTCSMHPQVKLSKPGKCPLCFMDLVPAEGEEATEEVQEELEKLRIELRVVLKEIVEREKALHGEAAGPEVAKLLMEEMKRVSKETGIAMAGGCCPMHMGMMKKCMGEGTCPMMKKGSASGN